MFSTVSETTFRESTPASNATPPPLAPPLTPEDSRLILGNKQLAATAFMVIAFTTLVATLSYVAGRATTPAPAPEPVQARQQAAAPVRPPVQAAPAAPSRAAEQVIVVDPKPAAAPQEAKPENEDLTPTPGAIYYQVASVDKGMADVSVQYLRDKGFAARRAPGASPAVYRVLVGPLGAQPMPSQTEARLKSLGFNPFPKKY